MRLQADRRLPLHVMPDVIRHPEKAVSQGLNLDPHLHGDDGVGKDAGLILDLRFHGNDELFLGFNA